MQENAFIGKREKPDQTELAEALGPAMKLWDELVKSLSHEAPDQEWSSYSPKAGWALKLKKQDRVIVYLSPRRGWFLASFALGDKAVKAAKASDLPKPVVKLISEAKKYAEGTAVRIEVKSAKDGEVVRKLAKVKVEN